MKKIIYTFVLVAILHFINFSGNLENCNAQWVLAGNYTLGPNTFCSFTTLGNNIFIGPLYNLGVYYSTNNGDNWIATNQCGSVYALATLGTNVYAGSSQTGVFRSTNNGVNWTQTSLNNKTVNAFATLSPYIFAGVANDGIYFSTNSGINWTQTSFNSESVNSFAVHGNTIFAGAYGVYTSTNNGTSWNPTTLVSRDIYALAVKGDTIYAGTFDHGVYVSFNNGVSWSQTAMSTGTIHSLAVVGNNVLAGTYGAYLSTNCGANWVAKNDGLSLTANFNAFLIFGNNIFAATDLYPLVRRSLTDFTGIQNVNNEVPAGYSLSQNFPNPFNPSTVIRFQLPVTGQVVLKVYDVMGREVSLLVNEKLNAGTYSIEWDASQFTSGTYFYKITSGDFSETKKMLLLK